MLAHGIPNEQTAALAADLEWEKIEDIQGMAFYHMLRVPHELRSGVLALRNRYKCAGESDWVIPADVDWDHWDELYAQVILQLAGAGF
jgi:hypothetical protein